MPSKPPALLSGSSGADGLIVPQCGRHHAVFTDAPLPMLAAEADHLRHAIID
jgi:hypothetical protein